MSKIIEFLMPFKTYLLGGMVLLLAVSSMGWYMTSKNLDVEKQLRKTDKITYEAAQKEYELKEFKARTERERQYAENARQSEKKYNNLHAEYARNLVRFQAAQSEARRLAAAAKNRSAGVPVRASESPEILITTDDGLICAENTAKLKAIQDWALKLKDVK
jgi:hypothetical protein